jgi:hypothetical protein
VCRLLVIGPLQDLLDLTAGKLLSSMKHLSSIGLVFLESFQMVCFRFLSALLDPVGGLVVVIDQIFGLGEQKVGVLVCRSEIVGFGGGSGLSWLWGRSGEDVCEESANVVVEVRVEVRPDCVRSWKVKDGL